nr:hypothetical protein [Tanacetum cinerariifolium]
PVSDEDLREYCDKNYHQILPIIAEKLHQEKAQQEKLKAVKARLNFIEASQYSESETPSRRRNLQERLGPRYARTRSGSPEPRLGLSKSPREKDPERRTMFKTLEKGVFYRLGDKENNVSAHSRGSEQKSYYGSRSDTESCYQSSRSKETKITSEKHRHKREFSQRTEAVSESERSAGGHWKSKPKKQKSSIEDDLSQPWVCEETYLFTPWIRYFDFPKARMPSHIKTYDGSKDPKDHLKIFQAAAKTERWAMPNWRHMFNSTLIGNARVWFDDLSNESIDSYDDLRKTFLENYLQQKKCIKYLVEIHNIKQRDEEYTKEFVRRGEVAASNQEMKKFFPSRKQEAGQKQNFQRGNFRNEQRMEQKQDKFTLLTKTPKEILALDKGKFKPPPPMTTPVEKRNTSKFCEFHGEVGHTTDEWGEDGTEIPMIIEAEMGGHCVHRIYVDGGSSSEILYKHCFSKFHLEIKNQLIPTNTPLVGFSREIIWPLGKISLLVKISDEEHSTSNWMNFMVSNMIIPLECSMVSEPGVPRSFINQVTKEKIQVAIHPEYQEQTIAISSSLIEEGQKVLCELLRHHLDVFAWKPSDMTGVPRNIAEHRLNVRKGYLPIRQMKRGLVHERNKAINEEVKKGAFKEMKQLIAVLPMLMAPREKEELIMYLNDAKEANNAVLITERDRKQVPIYFVSRALQGPEINYTPMEKLILALVTGRLLKWRFELGEPEIQYRPRTSVKGQILADFIVERPEEDTPDTPMDDREELPDPWILFTDGSSCIDGSEAGLIIMSSEGMEFTYALRFIFNATNNEAEYKALIAGLRVAGQIGVQNLQINVDLKIVANQGSCSMHAGPRSVVATALRSGYYWPTMHMDARNLIRECKDYQGIDIAGPFSKGPDKVKFLIVEMDYFTKWIEARPVAIITRAQKHRRRNQGTIGGKNKNWVEEVSHVLWAHHTMIKSSNEETSFSLTYGAEVVIPAEIGMPTLRTAKVDMVKNNEALGINLDLLEEKREQTAIQEARNKSKMERYYNARVRSTSFHLGDFVYRSNEASHARDGGKLRPKWEGPYEVTEALGKGPYMLRDRNGHTLPRTWNIYNLKKCYMHEM